MNASEALSQLESLGTAQNRKIYKRHGLAEPMFGVSFAHLRRLRKQIKRDHPLAQALWETRNHDAQILSAFIADPREFDTSGLDAWARQAVDYLVADEFAKEIVLKTPEARRCASKWVDDSAEVVQRVGWSTLGSLAISLDAIPGEFFSSSFPKSRLASIPPPIAFARR